MTSKTKENIILSIAVLISNETNDVIEIGNNLVKENADLLTDGGFWIWDINSNVEFYSPNFRKSLGFEGEHDFPSTPDSWMKWILPKDKEISIKNFNRTLNIKGEIETPYYQEVTYNKKNGSLLKTICSGLIVRKNKKPKYLIGTHKLL